MRVGDQILVIGPIGLGGTMELLSKRENELRARFSLRYLEQAQSHMKAAFDQTSGLFYEGKSGLERKELFQTLKRKDTKDRMEAFRPVEIGQEGFLCALWRYFGDGNIGLSADIRKVPVLQETIEICECFGLDPYGISGTGAWLCTADDGYGMYDMLCRRGIRTAIIGHVTEGKAKILWNNGTERYLNRP